MILGRLSASMKRGTMILGLVALNGAAVYADDVPASASSTEQAQARQFGIYFGGMASQYDLCVKKEVFSVWPGCSGIRTLARRRRPRGVTPVRLPDFVRCHFHVASFA
jgi:hypothetical protein